MRCDVVEMEEMLNGYEDVVMGEKVVLEQDVWCEWDDSDVYVVEDIEFCDV